MMPRPVISRPLVIGVVAMFVLALAMSIYVWRARPRLGAVDTPSYSGPVTAPVAGPTEHVTLYVAYDDSGTLRAQGARIPLPAGRQERAQELLRALLALYLDKNSSHPLAAGAELRDVYLVDPALAVIDLNGAFANEHRSGVLVEELTVGSMVETLAANIPGIMRVKILIDGKSRETLAGHADLSSFYDVGAVGQMVGELQGGQ